LREFAKDALHREPKNDLGIADAADGPSRATNLVEAVAARLALPCSRVEMRPHQRSRGTIHGDQGSLRPEASRRRKCFSDPHEAYAGDGPVLAIEERFEHPPCMLAVARLAEQPPVQVADGVGGEHPGARREVPLGQDVPCLQPRQRRRRDHRSDVRGEGDERVVDPRRSHQGSEAVRLEQAEPPRRAAREDEVREPAIPTGLH